jgi:hypothetical protein
MERFGKYGVQTAFTFVIPKAGSTDFAATGDWTPATGDTKISKDGGSVGNTTNNPSAVAGTGSVLWTLTLTATEMQAAVIDIQIVDAATKAVTDQAIKIYTFGNASAKILNDWTADVAQTGDSYAKLPASPAAVGSKMDIADAPSATGLAAMADAILTRAFTSVTYTGTVRCLLTACQAMRNKFTAASGVAGYVVKKEDDSTTSWTGTITVDGNGVITGMDPD